jgi:hypothetical protein
MPHDHSFMRKFSPWIAQFDTKLHTFAFVRRRSSFLLTAILSAAAKAFNPTLRPSLHAHATGLMSESFSRGTKSVEVIHAMLLLTYWKEPDDTRVWLSVGYVIRMCMELGWHKLRPKNKDDPQDSTSETARRMTRDVERLWLVIFVYDRRLLLPPMATRAFRLTRDPQLEFPDRKALDDSKVRLLRTVS